MESGEAPIVPQAAPEALEAALEAAAEPAAPAAAEEPSAAAAGEPTAAAAEEPTAAAAGEPSAAAEGAAARPLRIAGGVAHQFYHKSAAKDDLKIKDKNWKRYLSTFAPFTYRDVHTPAVSYTCLEAVLGAAKYQRATDKPELGAQTFGALGNIHQAIIAEKAALTEGKRVLTPDEEASFSDKEGTALRNAQKPTEIRKTGAKFKADKWDEAAESVLNDYLRQRFEGDAHFRQILEAAATLNVRLVYYVAGGGNELSGTVNDDGTIEGRNLYGRALMRLVGMTY